MIEVKRRIRYWWNSSPCCSKVASAPAGTKEFYEQVDLYKDTYEPFTDQIADYGRWKGKRVLEIGCGLGKDFSRFISAGAKATAIDMSNRSLALTAKRLAIFGLKGNLCLADAESLPFKDNVFDLVFSWGVLHHTPDTQKAINEIHRCLNSDCGKIIIMLYNKHSLKNMQIILLYTIIKFNLADKIKRISLPWKRYNQFKNLLSKYGSLDKEQILPSFTDGFGNPLSKVYSSGEILKMFLKFKNINICAYESKDSSFAKIFDFFKTLEKNFGWFIVITAEK